MIIDAYSHMLNPSCFENLKVMGGRWVTQRLERAAAQARRKPQMLDLSVRLDQLKAYGIDHQVVAVEHTWDCNLLPGDTEEKLRYAGLINDSMAELAEDSKGTLIGVGNVPLENFERNGRRELERAVHSLGLKGIMVISNILGLPLDSTQFEPFWASAAQMGIPVFIHPIDPVDTAGRRYEGEYDLLHNFGWPYETVLALARLVFSGIMERYPTLKVVSHHLGGGMIPFFWGRTLETYERENQQIMCGDQCPPLSRPLFEYFSRFYYDTAVGGSGPAIRCAYEVFGAERLIFATDCPFGPGTGEQRLREYPKVIEALEISAQEKRRILHENALRMLNMD